MKKRIPKSKIEKIFLEFDRNRKTWTGVIKFKTGKYFIFDIHKTEYEDLQKLI